MGALGVTLDRPVSASVLYFSSVHFKISPLFHVSPLQTNMSLFKIASRVILVVVESKALVYVSFEHILQLFPSLSK